MLKHLMKGKMKKQNEVLQSETKSKRAVPMENGVEGKSSPRIIYTAKELIDMKVDKLPYLVEMLFQKTGLVAISGSSDTGKSSFLRQLAYSIVNGDDNFLGFKINATHRSVIYVSTEDDNIAMAHLLYKQSDGKGSKESDKNLRFLFDTDNLYKNLDKALTEQPVDCVIVDAFLDLYHGDLNMSNQVRTYITDTFKSLVDKHGCLIIFLQHSGKKAELSPPSKNHVLGSQGFEGKMRLLLELRKDPANPELRHLCIVKGNYIKESEKAESFVLYFDEKQRFSNTNRRVPFDSLVKPNHENAKKRALLERVKHYHEQKLSSRDISVKMKEEGHEISKSTIAEMLKVIKQPEKDGS
jgi:RecA-family ATPase